MWGWDKVGFFGLNLWVFWREMGRSGDGVVGFQVMGVEVEDLEAIAGCGADAGMKEPCVSCTTFNILAPIYKRLDEEVGWDCLKILVFVEVDIW